LSVKIGGKSYVWIYIVMASRRKVFCGGQLPELKSYVAKIMSCSLSPLIIGIFLLIIYLFLVSFLCLKIRLRALVLESLSCVW